MKLLSIIFAMVFSLAVVSCGKGSSGSGDNVQNEDTPVTPLVYDSELSSAEKNALDQSTAALSSLQVDGSRIKGFAEVFGGNTSSDVVTYFGKRVHYALSASTDIESRIVVNPADPISPALMGSDIIASNIGAALWLGSAVEGTGTTRVRINDNVVLVNSSRVGIMQFGEFTRINKVQQVNTLVHEARHSDCTGGLTGKDLSQWRANVVPENKSCGHFHVICPMGHPYGGEAACDSEPWGAYTVGAIHSLTIAKACDTCSETDKTVAEQMGLDSLSRLQFDVPAMFEGRLGAPNMSSSNKVGN